MHCVETICFLTPFKQREIKHPKRRKFVLRPQAELLAHQQAQFIQLFARGLRRAGKD